MQLLLHYFIASLLSNTASSYRLYIPVELTIYTYRGGHIYLPLLTIYAYRGSHIWLPSWLYMATELTIYVYRTG
ncbi:MAG: hypothetical protein ACTTIN_08575 [Bacteroides pyogenes]